MLDIYKDFTEAFWQLENNTIKFISNFDLTKINHITTGKLYIFPKAIILPTQKFLDIEFLLELILGVSDKLIGWQGNLILFFDWCDKNEKTRANYRLRFSVHESYVRKSNIKDFIKYFQLDYFGDLEFVDLEKNFAKYIVRNS